MAHNSIFAPQARGYSSVGRATGSQSVGHGFDSHYLHKRPELVFRPSFIPPLYFALDAELHFREQRILGIDPLVIGGQSIMLVELLKS